MNVWYDLYANVLFVTIGKRRPGYHRWIEDGIALRFDDETDMCVGFIVVIGMLHKHDTILPLWTTIMMMADAIIVNATVD